MKYYILALLCFFLLFANSCSNRINIDDVVTAHESFIVTTTALENVNDDLYYQLGFTKDSIISLQIDRKSTAIKEYIIELKRGLMSNHIYNTDTVEMISYSYSGFDKDGDKREMIFNIPISSYSVAKCKDVGNVQKTSNYFKTIIDGYDRATALKMELNSYISDINALLKDTSGFNSQILNTNDLYSMKLERIVKWEEWYFTNVSFISSVSNLESFLLQIVIIENNALHQLLLAKKEENALL